MTTDAMSAAEGLSSDDLRRMVEEIDRALAAAGVAIDARPLKALGIVSERTGLALPLDAPFNRRAQTPGAVVAAYVFDWFKRRYGAALNVDWSVGRTVVELHGDLWRLIIPTIYGSAKLVCDTTLPPSQARPRTNIVDYVESDSTSSLPAGIRSILTVQDRDLLVLAFTRGLSGYSPLYQHRLAKHHLVSGALADLSSAVVRMTSRPANFGQSRFSSLQVVEKALKVTIEERKGKYPKAGRTGHDLQLLAGLAANLGVAEVPRDLLRRAECSSEVRYGDVPSTRSEAVDAHYASLEILKMLGPALSAEQPPRP